MVKAKTLQVVWHSKEPVYSVDFHPNGQLFTGGADKEVKVWEVERDADGYPTVRHLSSLTAHLSTVNCVRFSPTGQHLASSGDGGEVLVWEAVEAGTAPPRRALGDEAEGEALWRRCAALKGHAATGDVMDLAWSPDGTALASASIDAEVLLFGWGPKRRGDHAARFKSHKHFVQGLAWDPAQQHLASQSADRTARVYSLKPPAGGKRGKVSQHLLPAGETARDMYCAATLSKRALGPAADGAKAPAHPLFADERVPTFFRRPAWSPDGSLLVLPAGIFKASAEGREVHTAHVYARGRWASPAMHLPGHAKPVVAVRFCPVLFQRDDGGPAAAPAPPGPRETAPLPFDLPYKMVMAVATLDSVVLYDTQSALPLALLGHLHYDSITDLAWSADGRLLAVSSRDCYCSLAAFEEGELGTPLPMDRLAPHIAKRVAAAQRRAEPLKPPQGATPAARKRAPGQTPRQPGAPGGTPAAARAGVEAPLGTPAAQPPLATPHAGAHVALTPASPAGASEPQAVPAARDAGAVQAGVKRPQPEPASADGPLPAAGEPTSAAEALHAGSAAPAPPAAAPQQAPPPKKPKRVVPEAVGQPPLPGADPAPGPAPPSSFGRGAGAAAAKAPRRIVPQAVGGIDEPPRGAADVTPLGRGVTKPPGRRIVPEAVGAPAVAAKSSHPAESAASGKAGAKRITPTPLRAAEAAGQPFDAAAAAGQPPALAAASEQSRDGHTAASGRRITPIPIGTTQALPTGEERTATAGAGGGIAALAAALGAAAAQGRSTG